MFAANVCSLVLQEASSVVYRKELHYLQCRCLDADFLSSGLVNMDLHFALSNFSERCLNSWLEVLFTDDFRNF